MQGRAIRRGLGVGVLLAIAVTVPFIARGSEDGAPESTGRAVTEAAGCDRSRTEVRRVESVFDYYVEPDTGRPIGAPSSLEEAVLSAGSYLADDGAVFSREELRAAAAAANADADPIEVRPDGVVISVERWDAETYLVRGIQMCA